MNIWIPLLVFFNFFLNPIPLKSEALLPCPSEKTVESWTNCKGTYIDSIGGKYVGGWKNGKFHGQGTTTFNDKSKWAGDKYDGGWKNGKKYGQGTYTYADESAKEGIWFNDRFLYSKKKKVTKSNVTKAPTKKPEPEDLGDLPECPPETPLNKWTKCIGSHTEFNLEKIPPTVRLTAKNYLIKDLETDPATIDQVITDLMTGVQIPDETTEHLVDMLSGYGGTYVVAWKDGKFHGEGTASFGKKTRWAREKYSGSFKGGKRHGKGTYIYSDGSKYIGEFANGQWNGQGTLINSFGDKYVGEFKDGKRHGKGTLSEKDGETYVGSFVNDIATGPGRLEKPKPQPKPSNN